MLLFVLCASAAVGSSDRLYRLLHRLQFRNDGLTLRSHEYSWETVAPSAGSMFYLEPQNVSRVQSGWGGNHGVHRFLRPAEKTPAAAGACGLLSTRPGFDIGGHDLKQAQAGVVDSSDCVRICCEQFGCDGAVFLPPPTACGDATKPCCFLKRGAALAARSKSALPGVVALGVNSSTSNEAGIVPLATGGEVICTPPCILP
jgi:hypothetical protein